MITFVRVKVQNNHVDSYIQRFEFVECHALDTMYEQNIITVVKMSTDKSNSRNKAFSLDVIAAMLVYS